MKYIISFLCTIVFTIGIALNSASAQTKVTITGNASTETCIENTYIVAFTSVPTGFRPTSYVWTTTNLNPSFNSNTSCGGTINNSFGGTVTITDTLKKNVVINWGDLGAPLTSTLTVLVNFTNSTGATINATTTKNVNVFGVCSNLSITGAGTVQRCCNAAQVYTVANFDGCASFSSGLSGFAFNWTIPSTWTIASGQGTSAITVIPDAQNSGSVNCKVSRPASGGGTNRTTTLGISRFAPVITVNTLGAVVNLCPGTNTVFTVGGNTCNLGVVQWSVPNTWSIVSGQGTQTLTAKVGSAGSSGNITANGFYIGNCTATAAAAVEVLSGTPPTPTIQWDQSSGDYTYFHCGEWFICPRDGEAQMTALVLKGTTSLTWKLSGFWRFDNGLQTMTVPVNITTDTYVFSPYIQASCDVKGGATLRVFSENCLGRSAISIQSFLREEKAWCKNSCYHTCYPSDKPCLGVSDEFICKGPFNKVASDASSSIDADLELSAIKDAENESVTDSDLVINPNPNSGTITIKSKEDIIGIRLMEINGKVVLDQKITKTKQHQMDLPNQVNGMYFLEISSENGKKIKKIIIQR